MLARQQGTERQVKVVTENGIVYLMGLVTRAEGAAATNVASGATGVQKIVTPDQYTN